MSETINIANAMLIIASLYFMTQDFPHNWILWFFILWGCVFWAYHGFSKERKKAFESAEELDRAKISYYHAKEEYYKRKGEVR